MIPLVRPPQPDWRRVEKHFAMSRKAGKLSNFGPCYWALVERLMKLDGRYSVPCTSGTAAVQLAAQVAFPRGSRILCPDYTHVGTLQALIAAGMVPVLSPVAKMTWTLSGAAVTSGDFDGFVVVSPFGYRVDFKLYDALSAELKKPVIYDLAGGFGMKAVTVNPVCYSMHATKNLPIGEGGIASFTGIEESSRAFGLSCFDQNVDRTIETPFGGNFKLDELRCAVALAHLDDMGAIAARMDRKGRLIDMYQDLLGSECIAHSLHIGNAAPSLCVLAGLPAEHLEKSNQRLGFEVKQYYPLLSGMPGLSSVERKGVSSPFFRTCMALPSDVTDEEAKTIAKAIRAEAKAHRARAGH